MSFTTNLEDAERTLTINTPQPLMLPDLRRTVLNNTPNDLALPQSNTRPSLIVTKMHETNGLFDPTHREPRLNDNLPVPPEPTNKYCHHCHKNTSQLDKVLYELENIHRELRINSDRLITLENPNNRFTPYRHSNKYSRGHPSGKNPPDH